MEQKASKMCPHCFIYIHSHGLHLIQLCNVELQKVTAHKPQNSLENIGCGGRGTGGGGASAISHHSAEQIIEKKKKNSTVLITGRNEKPERKMLTIKDL